MKTVNHLLNGLYVWMSVIILIALALPRMHAFYLLIFQRWIYLPKWTNDIPYNCDTDLLMVEIYAKNVNGCQSIEQLVLRKCYLNKLKRLNIAKFRALFWPVIIIIVAFSFCLWISLKNAIYVHRKSKRYHKKLKQKSNNQTQTNQSKPFNSWTVSPLPFGHI